MNKIFKVIWSKSKQCYIVVSEMAKNHSGKKKIVVASILATMAVGSGAITNMVDAAGEVSQGGGNPKTPGSIAIGYGSVSDGTVIHNDGSTTVQPSIAIGVGAKSMGNSSVSVGQGAQVLGYSYSVAVGRSSEANGDYGVSVGYNTRAKLHGIAMGEQARAMKEGATTFGVSSRGYGNGSIAIGWQSLAGANVYDEDGKPGPDINQDPEKTISDYNKWGDTAIGIRAVATGGNALALGRSATAKAANAVAIGGGNGSSYTDNTEKTEATAEKAVAIGYKTEASAVSSVALGTSAVSGGENGVAIGNDAQAQTANTIAVGSSSRAENANDSAFGNAAKATGGGATAIGYTVTTSGNQAFGAGSNSEVSGAGAVGIGYKVKASGNRAISIGNDNDSIQTEATGEKAIAIGSGVKATGSVSIAMGRNAQSLREYTTAIGTNVIASNKASGSTIIGYNSFTKGNQSVNIGSTNETLEEAQYSTAIGYDVRAKAKNAIAIGSSGETSEKVIAAGQDAIAIGTSTQGNAVASTAIGKKAIASSENSIAFGTSAKGVGTSATAIGNGATTAKANAIALGTSAQGTGESSTAIGNGAQATNSHAFAAGTSASATGETSTAVGNSASAAGARAVAVGTNTSATQEEGVAVGLRAKAKGIRSVSVGIDTESTTSDGISVGYLSKSQGLGAIAIGRNAVVSGDKSVAVGYDLTVTDTGSTNIGYTSSVAGNQAVSVGARNTVEAGASAGAALGYFVNLSGKNAIGIGAGVNDTNRVTASGDNSAAIGTLAKATAASAMALGSNANAALAHSVALGEGSTTTEADGAGKTAYLSGESTNNSGNGVISVGNKRNDSDRTATITRRIVSVAGGTDDYDAVNIKQLKALEKNEWLLRTQNAGDANPTDVEPQTVNNQTKKRVTLKAGDNIAISNSNGVVTLNVTNVVKTVTSGNTAALTVNNNNGAVTITPNVASSVGAANEDNKLVTSGKVKAALDDKIDKTAEMHIKSGEYTVNTDGTASLIQQNGNNQDQTTRVTIKDIAKKSVLDTLQSDYNTFKMKAITFTGDDNQGVARTLDTTLTVKGGANYTSTTTNTNIRVEKDAANGANGLLVKLSDKLSGMKEIAGTGSQDLVIKNGNTTVTVKAPANGDKGTVDFGDAKVIAKNLDASIAYKAGNGDTKKTVKLQDGFNFTAATDTAADTDVPKSGLAITTGTNGVVTFGLDKATREKVDNAADKNLSNLSDTGKDKVKELAKTAAQDAVKVANGINTTVEKDTATAGVTTYKVNANDTTVAVTGNGLAITGGELGTDKVRKYSLDLSADTKGKLAAVGNLATNVIGGTTIAADGTVTGPTFSITKADGTAENAGTIKEAIEKLDAANKGQNTKISDTVEKVTNLATALGGGAKVENGTFTGPTYNITKADGSGTETASNVGDAISKLDTRITTANGTLVTKGLDFTGNDTTNAGKVHRDLGTTLTIKGAENFSRAATENNIKVVKNGDALDVKLAENLAKMKEISGDGTSDLVIKNGDTKVTVKAPTSGDKGTVDFGDAKVIAKNLDASIAYKAGNGDTKKTVKLQDGFNFTAATDTAADTNVPKSGLAITTGANGVVTFGLDKATREKVDNAADKNLSNLSDDGKNKVKELAKGAAQDAVKVADGINTTVEKDTTTTGVTTYKVNANDTTVAVTGDGLAITGGDLGTDKVRKYSLDLSAATKGKLAAVGNIATNVIGGTTISANGTVTGPTFNITKADGTTEEATTIKDAIDKLNATNAGQNTKISETESKVKDIVDKGMTFAGDDAATDKVTRKLGETLNIHGQNNITVKKDGTAADTLNVKLASELKNITSISSGNGTTGSTVTLGADGVSIANTKDGATKTVTIGKDGINAGGMKITNVAEAKAAGDAANKKYVDDAISNLGNIVSGNATLNFAGNVTKDAQDQATEKVGLSLATGTLHVNGAENEITTTAKGDTITVGLAETVKAQLAKVGDTSSNGRDGKAGTSGAQGLTGKDGLNDKTLTDKVNALRNGEAGSVVYTDENGARLVKAKDGEYYKAADVDATGNVLNGAAKATTVEARVVNPDGTTTGGTTKLSNIADGKVATGSKDAVNGGQLNTVKTDLANALGGNAKVENGTFTGPTYNITKDDGSNTKEAVNNVGDAISKLDGRINNANTVLGNKGLDFYGNKDTADTDKVHRNLGEALKVKGAENFTRAEGAKNNIDVVKNTAGDGFDVKLAENLGNIKEIAGNGKDNLVIKNGDATITLKPKKDAEGTNPATPATVDFGETKVVASNLDASIKYRANDDAAAKAKSVKLADGFNFVVSNVTDTAAEGPKSGLAISAEDNGKVTFGLDKATRSTIDNAADKNLSNLSDDGKNKVKELAKGAAQDAVKVADGINTTVEKDTATAGVTTYKVNANDTTVAVTGDGLAITGGDLGTDKVRKYSLDLSAATKGKLKAVDGLSTVIGGTNITADGTVTGPKFNITKADGTTEEAKTIKDAIDKLNTTNAGQNTKISETAGKVTTLEGKVDGIVEKGMVFAGDNATADKVTRKLGETLNIHGQNNISVKKDATAEDTLNVKLASDLKNITSITNADADGKPGSKITLGADGVSIANTAAGADGAAGETKTVTIGKDGINAGGMKVTNVAKAEADGDAANKKYVDEAISNLGNIVSGNATLNFAGNVTKDAQDQSVAKVGLSLATGTLHVNGAENEIATTAKGDTITVGLAETVKAQLAKVGDTASNGRDGKDGTSGAKGLTGKDGLNDKTLTDKVNALRNGEAGSVVYTNDAGDRVVKAKDGKYYKADEVKADGTVKTAEENKGKAPKVVENPQARVVNGNGETTAPTTLSNIADGKVAADSKEAVNGGQLYTAKSEIGAIIGGTTINENGKITGPTFSITNAAGTKDDATTIKDAIEKLDATNAAQNTKISGNTEKLTQLGEKVTENYNDLSTKITQAGTNVTNALTTKGLDFTGNDTTAKVHRDLGTTLTIKGADNFTRTDAETNNIKVVKNDNDLDVKLAENLGKIKSISNATGAGKPGSTITLGADGVSIANTAAGQDGAAGETKTVTIGKAGINAGGMKVTNVAKAEADGDAANKAYVDNAISNLNTTVTNNANLRYAGDTNEGVAAGEDHLNLPLATGTLKVAGTADQIKTVANNGTITLSLAEKVTDKLAKLGDTSSNGRDGKDGTSGAQGLTGKDGLNDKTLTEKVNALRNGEAGSVVYTDENGARLVKAKDGEYYKVADVDKDGNVLNGAKPATTVEARLVNPKGETTVPTKLSNIADGKVAADSKEAVNGGQLHTVKSDLATALGGDSKVNADGSFTGPTYSITKDDGSNTKEAVNNVGDAISKLDGRINNANTTLANKGLDFTGNGTTAKVHRNLGETLTIKGAENFTRTDAETNNIKVVKNDNDLDVKLAENLGNIKSISNATGAGKPGSTITLGADGVSIANTAVGADGAAGETKTVTIGKDGINAGDMKITNVAKAEAEGDATNKKYVDDAIKNLNTTVTNNANLRYAGDTNEGAANGDDHLNLPLATGTLKVAGTADQIKTVANNGTITLSLDEKVTNKLDKLGDTASNGRDGANGLTGKDGLNDKTLTDKVNALRNGEAGSVVYTNDAGDRVVKAKDGKYYKADEVKADGTVKTAEENNGKAPKVVENPQARVVNGNGETTVPTTLSNIADGKVAANSKDAVNGGQLNTVKSDLATALGGGAKVENGVFTGPTYNITKDDGSNTTEAVNNVGDAISKLDGRINNANTVLSNKGLDFYGNKDAADTDKVHRNLGEALKVKGAENFTREANAKNNIDVVKNTAGDGFDVKLAENLGNIKEIAGNGKDNLVIKNGDATITLKPKKDAEGTNPATPATVDFGDTKVVASNLDASIKYRANDEAATNAKSVKLADGFNFVASTDATTTAEGPKSGLAITAEDNGKVTFGLDKATREKVDNAADKNLSNLTDAGKNKVKELAGEAAKAAVTVADGINTTVTTDTTTTTGVTTYKVNANDTTVAVNADSLAISGGTPDATTKVRAYTLDLSDTVKAKLNAINNVGDTASNGRDGVNGTSGATGLTGKDGLNDKTLTDKVNALRNGEAGSVVYTNDAGDRVVKAKDGKYYKADEVKADGTVKTAEENKGKKPEEVTTPQARVVNPNGETTAPTTLSNIADGKVAADSKDAVNGGQLHTVKSDLATALGGGAKVENGTFTGPTYNITKDDGTGTEAVKNVGDAISKLDGRINNANTVLGNKGLDFTGNDTTDVGKVHRNLGETLTIKGADNFTRTDAETNNIKVVKNNNDLDVKLAENLGNIKEIAGNGKDNLVIKNGDATITLKPKKEAEGTNPATPATVDFGNAKVVAPNLEASITYRANSAEDANAKTVTLQKGLNFVSGDGTAATAEAAKAGITIAADKDGKVVFGLNEATRNAIDNAADKNLSNLSQDGKNKVADLAKTAARDAVKVTAGNNVTVTSETKDGNTTYTVNGRDTTVKAADNGSVSVTGGTLNAKGEREYTVDLTADAKAELGKISDLNTRLGSAEGKITTLQGDMTKAKDDIAANTKAIDANKEAIAANKNAIADNARDIAANRKDIDTNKQGIAENKKQIGENAKAIAKNAEDIKKNAQDIKNNTETIKSNTDRIQTVENRVTTAEGKIATNEKAIKDNASAIQSNTKAIGANTTAIAKNASDITKANKEIESLKGNSATKDLSNLTNTGKDTITNLINVTGEHGITVTPSTDSTTRVKTFTAKLNDTVTFGSGDKKITVDGTTGTVTSKAVAADTVKANTVNAKTVQLGDSTGTNTTVTADGIAVTTKNPDGTTSKVEIKNGTVSGLTNTKWDPAKVVTDADRSVVATQGQVKDVMDTLARGRVFVGDTGNTVTVGLGDTLAIKGGATKALTDDNIGVVSTEAKDGKPATMTVKLAKDVKMKDGSTSYDYYLPEIKTNPDGSKEIVKNADGSVKHQLGKDGNPIRLVTTTVNGEGITIAPVKGLDKPTVSLTADGLDNGGNQIHNVAAGTANTDAATVGQVRAAAHALNNRVNEAGAHAAALAAMNPLSYDPLKKSQVMAGVGSYKGNKALALGVAHYANEDTLFNVGVAVGDGSNMVNAGVTYRFGGEYSAVPERYKGGPISSVYVMQDEVSALKAENAEMKEQMKMLMERIEMLAAK
ncbi:YadA-like family protein [Veillonella sp. CHU594]|uniref:YadA-like family protein n=1 Tax=Veillonella sp. CHU594 TaxID=2490948 RepID=UPI000F8E1166|nr:YadA-like family protein [Veillonella sp. CHU594]